MNNLKKKIMILLAALAMALGFTMISDVSRIKAEAAVTPTVEVNIQNILKVSEFSNGTVNMVPQGICVIPDYMLVSAYDEKDVKGPVIYVFTKADNKYLGTFALPKQDKSGANHVGGLAYDGSNIWVSVGTKVGCFNAKSAIDKLKLSVSNFKVYTMDIKYKKVIPVACQASTLGYDSANKRLWVAKYNDKDQDKAYSYSITKDDKGEVALKKISEITVPRYTQGIAFKENRMLISTSTGILTSYIHVYDWNGKNYTKQIDKYALPILAEGVAIDSDYVYVAFEAPANKFKDNLLYAVRKKVDYFGKYSYDKFGLKK